jgi:hypothetical protein
VTKADIERELQKIRTTPAHQSGNIAVRALGYDPGRPWSKLTAEEQEKISRHVADRGAERRVCAEPVRLVRK